MGNSHQKAISRFMSLVLRHQPDLIGISLDAAGWTEIDALLRGMKRRGRSVTRQQLERVVRENDKQRFQISECGLRIRATQGHSVPVDLGYEPAVPPARLYHGTPEQYVASILRQGLLKQQRHHVHLHEDLRIARNVGERRGRAVILTIRAQDMSAAGHEFFVTPNHVWLTDHVPPDFLDQEASQQT